MGLGSGAATTDHNVAKLLGTSVSSSRKASARAGMRRTPGGTRPPSGLGKVVSNSAYGSGGAVLMGGRPGSSNNAAVDHVSRPASSKPRASYMFPRGAPPHLPAGMPSPNPLGRMESGSGNAAFGGWTKGDEETFEGGREMVGKNAEDRDDEPEEHSRPIKSASAREKERSRRK